MKTLMILLLTLLPCLRVWAQPCTPGATIRVGTDCSCNDCTDVTVMSLESYVSSGLDDEWIPSWNIESLKAGAVAYRSYGAYYINNPYSGVYDLANTTCKQVWEAGSSANCVAATTATAGQVLSQGVGGPIARSEYAAETNNFGCGDGFSGCTTCGTPSWPCISDPVCAGKAAFGHWRGMCQWGSQRWAQSGRDYTWILNHYYNPGNVYVCTGSSTACSPVTGNDYCFGPPAPPVLTVGSTCSYTNGTTCGATVSIATGSSCSVSGSNANVRDVWYAFVATGSAHNIVVQSGENFDAVVEVYGSACSTATRIGTCTNAAGSGLPETVTLTTLTAGSTYYIRVFDYHENAHTSLPGGATFSICVHTPCFPQPIANFIASQTTGLCPFYVNFFDMSATTGAVSRLWTIYNGGGTPITTTTQNPTSILYNVFGAYLVKLTVTDACGSDTKYVSGYINVTGGPCAVGVEEQQLQPLLDVYPNPTTGSFVVSSALSIASITVANMVGQQVICPMQQHNDGKIFEVSLAGEPAGVYFLTIHTQAGMAKRKIVKE